MSKSPSRSVPKILLVAEHASAKFGGEALIPFQYFKNLREVGVDIHLVVHERTRAELLEAFSEDRERLHFVADSALNIWCCRAGALLPDRIAAFTFGAFSHLDTQIRQRSLVRSLILKHHFDIVHEPIPVSPKLPSVLFGLSTPVIIGPMNGGMDYPQYYRAGRGFEQCIIAFLRTTAAVLNVILPGKRRASLLLVANRRTFDALPTKLKSKRIIELVENGVDTNLFQPLKRMPKTNDIFRLVHISRLVDFKRVDLLLDACARLKGEVNFRVDLVGDGPLRKSLEQQAQRLCLNKHVHFHGRRTHAEAAALLQTADSLVLTSMLECGGAVVLEAMACGIPVIATKWGGPTDYVIPETGILVPPATPEQFVEELAKAMAWMARNPQARGQMGEAGRRRAETLYDWRGKSQALLKIYEEVLMLARQPPRAL